MSRKLQRFPRYSSKNPHREQPRPPYMHAKGATGKPTQGYHNRWQNLKSETDVLIALTRLLQAAVTLSQVNAC